MDDINEPRWIDRWDEDTQVIQDISYQVCTLSQRAASNTVAMSKGIPVRVCGSETTCMKHIYVQCFVPTQYFLQYASTPPKNLSATECRRSLSHLPRRIEEICRKHAGILGFV